MKSFELNKEMGQKEHAEAQISQRPYLSRHGLFSIVKTRHFETDEYLLSQE